MKLKFEQIEINTTSEREMFSGTYTKVYEKINVSVDPVLMPIRFFKLSYTVNGKNGNVNGYNKF